jgi:transposase
VSPLTGDLGAADLAVLERWADPHDVVKLGRARLAKAIATASHNHQGAERADERLAAAGAALELYGEHPGAASSDLAAEVATEVRLLRAVQAGPVRHENAREEQYRCVDPTGLARSPPGLKAMGGPVLAATMGRATRSPSAAHFRSFTGLAPRASETGNSDRKGQAMPKAGDALLRSMPKRPRPSSPSVTTRATRPANAAGAAKRGKAPQEVLKGQLRSHARGRGQNGRPYLATTPVRSEADVKRSA